MNIYPALKANMGSWQYYIVKMSMREIAESVKLASDFYEDPTLNDAIQRVLDQSRVKIDLVNYLASQDDRFFSSIVVAAMGGSPRWYPVSIEDDPRFEMIIHDRRSHEAFGCLAFDGKQNYYALDGQHRLAAIKTLLGPHSDTQYKAPETFKDEDISVIVVVPPKLEPDEEFLVRYRRLFSNLNRYAKPTDTVTNIIMDEDDTFAILTRRLISEHDFFHCPGRQIHSARIKTKKGKNLSKDQTYFTSLETLYTMNILLLESRARKNNGWDAQRIKMTEFIKFRPDEDYIDELYDELKIYWDALIDELPILKYDPSKMRHHDADLDDEERQSNALFWPITQELFAEIVRDLMDCHLGDFQPASLESVKQSISVLDELNWDLRHSPWRNLILIPEDDKAWRMRNEDRKRAMNIAKLIIRWQSGIDQLDRDEVLKLKEEWEKLLLPALEQAAIDDLWSNVESAVIR